jgi:hypothetical protein
MLNKSALVEYKILKGNFELLEKKSFYKFMQVTLIGYLAFFFFNCTLFHFFKQISKKKEN